MNQNKQQESYFLKNKGKKCFFEKIENGRYEIRDVEIHSDAKNCKWISFKDFDKRKTTSKFDSKRN